MKKEKILVSADGPDCNVIKLKPPMVFTKENVDEFISAFDRILGEVAASEEDKQASTTVLSDTCKKPAGIKHPKEERIKSI